MKTSNIYKFSSSKATSNSGRVKYHLYIGVRKTHRIFLFINSKNYYGENYKIQAKDYSFLKYDSYIATTSVVSYPLSELPSEDQIIECGQLAHSDIQNLIKHIENSEIMTQEYIDFIIKKLQKFI